MKRINSRIFGETDLLEPTDPDFSTLENLIEKHPASVFGLLNKKLNENDKMLAISEPTEI